MATAYRVEVDAAQAACRECGHGQRYVVMGPGEQPGIDVRFEDHAAALDAADALNAAFDNGAASRDRRGSVRNRRHGAAHLPAGSAERRSNFDGRRVLDDEIPF